MINGIFPVEKFKTTRHPIFFYDIELLRAHSRLLKKETENKRFHVH
jgi:diaminopimelate decarboxylase